MFFFESFFFFYFLFIVILQFYFKPLERLRMHWMSLFLDNQWASVSLSFWSQTLMAFYFWHSTTSTIVQLMLLNLLISAIDQRRTIYSSQTFDGQLSVLVHLVLLLRLIHSKAFCVFVVVNKWKRKKHFVRFILVYCNVYENMNLNKNEWNHWIIRNISERKHYYSLHSLWLCLLVNGHRPGWQCLMIIERYYEFYRCISTFKWFHKTRELIHRCTLFTQKKKMDQFATESTVLDSSC